MKHSPDDDRLLARLAAGVLSRDGFLGADSRELSTILDQDNSAVEALGLSHERIAAKLADICQLAMANQGRSVDIDETLQAVYHDAMGPIPCPWGHGKIFAKGEIELTHIPSGQTLTFTPMSAHMIGEHGFYQGRGSKYRLEPAKLADILGLL